MILNVENAKDFIRKLLELISDFVKVEYKIINTQKSVLFLYTNKEDQKEKLRKHFLLPSHQK